MATSEKDQAVLHSIFNPLLPLGDIPPKHEVENENEINVENTEESKPKLRYCKYLSIVLTKNSNPPKGILVPLTVEQIFGVRSV